MQGHSPRIYVRQGVVLEAPDRVGTAGLSPSTRAMDEWSLSQGGKNFFVWGKEKEEEDCGRGRMS